MLQPNGYTTKELMGLLGVTTHTTIIRQAKREHWQSRPRKGRGGGHEWLISSMPAKTRALIAAKLAAAQPVNISEQIGAIFNVSAVHFSITSITSRCL